MKVLRAEDMWASISTARTLSLLVSVVRKSARARVNEIVQRNSTDGALVIIQCSTTRFWASTGEIRRFDLTRDFELVPRMDGD